MSDSRAILSDTVTRLFTDHVTAEVLVAAERGGWPGALWQTLEANGITQPLVPEERGGAGGTWRDAFVVARAAGTHLAPVPLVETIVASFLLAQAGLEVPAGPLTLAPVRAADRLRLERRGVGVVVHGVASRVPWGGDAHHLVTVGAIGDEVWIALVPGAALGSAGAATVAIERQHNVALEPRDTVTFAGAAAAAAAPAGPRVPANAVRLYGAMMRAAQIAGALERALEQAVEHVTVRAQFGRTLSKFQAIQHQVALLAEQAAAARVAAEHACRQADRGADAAFDIACAKVRAGEAAGVGSGIAHQVHGAIGFTYEHVLHFATRRLWAWRREFGAAERWAEELGRLTRRRGAEQLWPTLTAR